MQTSSTSTFSITQSVVFDVITLIATSVYTNVQ